MKANPERNPGMARVRLQASIALLALAAALLPGVAAADPAESYLVRISDAISPGTAEYIHQSLKKAEKGQAGCLIIELDTPGGLADSMRRIVQDILASP